MMRVLWRTVVPLVAGALVLAGCSDGGSEPDESPIGLLDEAEDADVEPDPEPEPEPEPEPPPEPDPATDDEPISEDDPYAVPDEIDVEYVDLVVTFLLSAGNDVLIDTASREVGTSLSEEARETLEAVSSGSRLRFLLDDFEDFSNNENRREAVFPPDEIGEIHWSTVSVIESDSSCIVASGYEDFSEIAISFEPRAVGVLVSLTRAEIKERNPTGWTIHDITPLTSGGEPVPEEAWGEVEFWDVLDNTCDSAGQL